MSPLTCQASWRFTPLRFGLWQRLTTHRSRLLRGRQFHQTPHVGRSVFPIFTPSLPSLTVALRVSLPTHTMATSTFFSLILLLPVVVLQPGSTSASSRHYVRSGPRELRPTPVLPRGHSSIATASNSMQRSGSSAEASASVGSPCTNNSATNKTPNAGIDDRRLQSRAGDTPAATVSRKFRDGAVPVPPEIQGLCRNFGAEDNARVADRAGLALPLLTCRSFLRRRSAVPCVLVHRGGFLHRELSRGALVKHLPDRQAPIQLIYEPRVTRLIKEDEAGLPYL